MSYLILVIFFVVGRMESNGTTSSWFILVYINNPWNIYVMNVHSEQAHLHSSIIPAHLHSSIIPAF